MKNPSGTDSTFLTHNNCITLWQGVRRYFNKNYYTYESELELLDHSIVLFNGYYPMRKRTAIKNLNNDSNPCNWNSWDFVYCVGDTIIIDPFYYSLYKD